MKVTFNKGAVMGIASLSFLALFACTGPVDSDSGDLADSGADTDTTSPPTGAYTFEARDGSGSSVSYSGQVFRHLLIDELKHRVGGLTSRIDSGLTLESGDVEAELEFYLSFDSASGGEVELSIGADLPFAQSTFDDVSSNKDLWGKLAGNDATGQHKDWSTDFVGGTEAGSTPQKLLEAWVAELDAAAVARSNGTVPLDPTGAPLSSVALTEDGRDLQQLLEKFLRVSIAFSQGTDDYLDDDLDGKGLNADHTSLEDGASYTALEHAWDEGFGYFGAAQTYGSLTATERAVGYHDADEDGKIDLLTEKSWGHSGNAGSRDVGSQNNTNMSGEAFAAFLEGRALLANTEGALTDAEMETLKGHRDAAVAAWERAIAATAIHYINETLVDTAALGTDAYSFADHAKHWSELKGFALGFQFNPRSSLSDADFVALHAHIGSAPELDSSNKEAAKADLLAARALLVQAFDVDPVNVGDDGGLGGW